MHDPSTLALRQLQPETRMSRKPQGRELTPRYRHCLAIEWHRTFPLWERIKILFGFTLVVRGTVWCVNRPGRYDPCYMGKLVKELSADDWKAAQLRESFEMERPPL